MSNQELRIGVIGVGGRGGLAANAHKPDEGVRLVAGADVSDAALNTFREKYGPETFTSHDYRDVISRPDIDAVFVTSPDFLHEEHAVAALEAGKDVYLEKPMSITIEGCDHILETAVRLGRKLYLGHNMRHFATVRKMKELIDAGKIGEVKAGWCRHFVCYGGDAYFKDWHADRTKSTGLLLQKGAHDIDILHWLLGGYTTRVTAMGGLTVYNQITDRHAPEERGDATWSFDNWPPLSLKGLNPVIDVEDISMMLMHLDNGAYASYQQCHFAPDGWRNYTIIGTEGRLENFGDANGELIIRLWNKRHHFEAKGDKEYPIVEESGSHGGSDARIVDEFIRYLREGGKTDTSPIAARYSVAAGVKATESIRSDSQPMDVPPAPADAVKYFG
ncbi:MAG TPA: Gfo/Idh/MocA family oxidoreductase [Armatimonadota bacterium]